MEEVAAYISVTDLEQSRGQQNLSGQLQQSADLINLCRNVFSHTKLSFNKMGIIHN
jgi:hypothetical protein